MAYIKQKKIWSKEFDKTELDEIWQIFINLCGDVDWENTEYVDYFRNKNIPYPETDRWDDTEGIKPKQLKKLLTVFDKEELKLFLNYLKGRSYMVSPYLDEGYVSWKEVLKADFLPMFEEFKTKENLLGEIGAYFYKSKLNTYYIYKPEIYKALFKQEIQLDAFNLILEKKPYKQYETLGLKDLSMENFWNERKELWKKELNVSPKLEAVLLMNPKYWNQKLISESIAYIFGVKQISMLKSNEIKNFLIYYKAFGENIRFLNNFVKEKKLLSNGDISSLNLIEIYEDIDMSSQSFEKIISAMNRGIEYEYGINFLNKILITLTYLKKSNEIVSKQRIKQTDLDVLNAASDIAISFLKDGRKKELENLDYTYLTEFNKYNISEENRKLILKLFQETNHLKTTIPLYKGVYGDYTFELIDKNDIRGLICGDAVNCCQRVTCPDYNNGTFSGNNSVYYGAREENSSFFIVSKKNRIQAQSWVWMKDKQLTFDNIEALGDSIREDIAKCYQLYANFVLKEHNDKVKRVTVGNGNSDLTLNKYWSRIDKFELIDRAYDARNTQYEIKYKEVK